MFHRPVAWGIVTANTYATNSCNVQSPSLCRYSPRGIFCSRTLNLRSISTIGYDMDYTLMHYNVMAWEGPAYDYCMENLKSTGFPVDGLSSDPDLVRIFLCDDSSSVYGFNLQELSFSDELLALGNQRSGHRQRACEIYGREPVDLRKEDPWKFLNKLFFISEAVAYRQVIVSVRKPEFFQTSHPMYEVVTSEGLMRPSFMARTGDLSPSYSTHAMCSQGLYSGGSAQMVENSLDVHGNEILYVGDHMYTDVSQSKVHLWWRTALICRELEEERLAATNRGEQELTESMQKLLTVMQRLDEKIAPLLETDGELFNRRYADIYTSRVSNCLHYTPFICFRSQEQHYDQVGFGGTEERVYVLENNSSWCEQCTLYNTDNG
ncbi:hypothetical protein NL676_020557 [Syzygium grande]|nr:hypothetical protein NL676_020557 [Syzygium grande]